MKRLGSLGFCIAVSIAAIGQKQVPRNEAERTAEEQGILGCIQSTIDWELTAGGTNPPTRPECWMYPVLINNGTMTAWRGPFSANQCGAVAAAYASIGFEAAALSWAKAGQCHNPEAQMCLERARWYTMHYLTTNEVAINAGRSVVGRLQDLNAILAFFDLYSKMPFPPFPQ